MDDKERARLYELQREAIEALREALQSLQQAREMFLRIIPKS